MGGVSESSRADWLARKRRPPMSPADVVASIVRQQGFGALEDPLHDVFD